MSILVFCFITACEEKQVKSDGVEDNNNVTAEVDFSSEGNEVGEESLEENFEIQYYESLDDHTELLFEAFISCDWKEVDAILEEFKKQKDSKVIVYNTPMEGLSLVIEYIPEVRSWQAYLGEFSEGKRIGNGVMVSKKESGYYIENIYIGEWDDDKPNGKGILSDSVNDLEHIFIGTFADGKMDSTFHVDKLETSELLVDWETITPKYNQDIAWSFPDIMFDNGKVIPATLDAVEQYIAISELTEHDLAYLNLENDGQYYYRIFEDSYNYILTIGAKAPADGYRGDVSLIYGRLFDSEGKEAIYGVACYATNRVIK